MKIMNSAQIYLGSILTTECFKQNDYHLVFRRQLNIIYLLIYLSIREGVLCLAIFIEYISCAEGQKGVCRIKDLLALSRRHPHATLGIYLALVCT